jgi:hypothetical protein
MEKVMATETVKATARENTNLLYTIIIKQEKPLSIAAFLVLLLF